MVRKSKWVCSRCGAPTEEGDRVCVVCKSGSTMVKGTVDNKKID
jgi:RNA polymerase subunit RPABC4/transcription elongation factor Spt4